MLVIGLVGGIGSGKSVASAMLAELGAEVINADLVGHEVYEPGKPGFDAIVAAFGAFSKEAANMLQEIDLPTERSNKIIFEPLGAVLGIMASCARC